MNIKTANLVPQFHPMFAALNDNEQLILANSAQMLNFNKHQVIYKSGQLANKIYFLTKGSIKITVHSEKKDIIKLLLRPQAIFGECTLMGDQIRHDCAYAMDDLVEIIEYDAATVVNLMRTNFAFAQSVLHFIGERLRHAELQLEKVVLKDSKSRILEYLKQLGYELGSQIGHETLVKHNMTHQDIADFTGTSRQMVTAVLNQLKRTNVLYFNRKKILFRDLASLPQEV